jgi:hypothetical protein
MFTEKLNNFNSIQNESIVKILKEIEMIFLNNNPFTSCDNYYYRYRDSMLVTQSSVNYNVSSGSNASENFLVAKEDILNSIVYKNLALVWEKISEKNKMAIINQNRGNIVSMFLGKESSVIHLQPHTDGALFSKPIFVTVKDYISYFINYVCQFSGTMELAKKEYSHNAKDAYSILTDIVFAFEPEFLASCFNQDDEIQTFNIFYRSVKRYNESCLERVENILECFEKTVYEKRDIFARNGDWFGYRVNESFKMFVNYIMKNKDTVWIDTYNKIKPLAERSYSDSQYAVMQYTLLAHRDLAGLKALFPNGVRKSKLKSSKRGAAYAAFLSVGSVDKKMIRRMRSESSSEASLIALKALLKYEKIYSEKDFNEYIALFSDSKHQDVVSYLGNNLSSKHLLGLIGNPLINNKRIFERINYLRNTES